MKMNIINQVCFCDFIPAVFFLLALSAFAPPSANADDFRHHEAHEHGSANLNVAVEGNLVLIEFISPAANIVGFEHEPKTTEQKTTVQQAIQLLEDGNKMFQFTAAAKCKLQNATVATDIMNDSEQEHHDEHGQDEHDDASHSEFKVEYIYHAESPEKLQFIDILLFQAFPGIDHIETQLLTATKQTSLELTAKNKRIDL